jgi:hypothetical protein
MYSKVFAEAKQDLDWLMKGADPTLPLLEEIVDSMGCRDPEYSFLGSHNAGMQSLRTRVLTRLATEAGYVIGIREEGLEWNTLKMNSYMKRAQELNRKLMFLM